MDTGFFYSTTTQRAPTMYHIDFQAWGIDILIKQINAIAFTEVTFSLGNTDKIDKNSRYNKQVNFIAGQKVLSDMENNRAG